MELEKVLKYSQIVRLEGGDPLPPQADEWQMRVMDLHGFVKDSPGSCWHNLHTLSTSLLSGPANTRSIFRPRSGYHHVVTQFLFNITLSTAILAKSF